VLGQHHRVNQSSRQRETPSRAALRRGRAHSRNRPVLQQKPTLYCNRRPTCYCNRIRPVLQQKPAAADINRPALRQDPTCTANRIQPALQQKPTCTASGTDLQLSNLSRRGVCLGSGPRPPAASALPPHLCASSASPGATAFPAPPPSLFSRARLAQVLQRLAGEVVQPARTSQ